MIEHLSIQSPQISRYLQLAVQRLECLDYSVSVWYYIHVETSRRKQEAEGRVWR